MQGALFSEVKVFRKFDSETKKQFRRKIIQTISSLYVWTAYCLAKHDFRNFMSEK